jgi:hypothetical protein
MNTARSLEPAGTDQDEQALCQIRDGVPPITSMISEVTGRGYLSS